MVCRDSRTCITRCGISRRYRRVGMNLKEEMYQEMKEDAYRDAQHDHQMRYDVDYAVTYYAESIEKAYDELRLVCMKLGNYGYEFTPKDLMAIVQGET